MEQINTGNLSRNFVCVEKPQTNIAWHTFNARDLFQIDLTFDKTKKNHHTSSIEWTKIEISQIK